ncbi:MAG: hypothetical protein R6X28_11380 [Bacteroidales bacterium]
MERKIVLIILVITFLSACLPVYKGISPSLVKYTEIYNSKQKVQILLSDTSFFNDMVKPKNELQFIAVKVINNDTLPFAITGSSVTVFNDFEPVEILSFQEYYRNVKFRSATYIAIGSAGFVLGMGLSNHGINPSVKNPGWLLTLGSGAYLFAASRANKKLKHDLINYDLYNMKIDPGSEVNGFLCISGKELKNLNIRIE